MEWLLAYLGIGVVVGFLAGLLGIGGGAVTVPLLVWAFGAQALPGEHVIRLALGTSMAVIFFTSLSSMRAHQKRGAVDWKISRPVRSWSAAVMACRIAPSKNPAPSHQELARPCRTGTNSGRLLLSS